MANPATSRSFVGRYFQLVLDGFEPAGYVRSVEGGGFKGELLAQQVGGQAYRVKGIHNPTIEPVTISVGMSMSKDFWDWVSKSWSGEVQRMNGSIITYDHNFKVVYEYEFKEALILETTIPALDASSKEVAFMTVKFQPEHAEHKWDPGGEHMPAKHPASQKLWLPCNFRLEVDGLDVKKVFKIDSFTVKQNVKPMTCGPHWRYQIEPTSLEYPNLSVTFSMAAAEPWFAWHKDFVAHGKNGPDNEKTGAITLLSTNLEQELLTVDLKALGIVNIALEKSDAAGQDTIRRVKAELYCEEMNFTYGG
jgi:phage tail-like protein